MTDFFYQASGIFLTENLTANEFDDILSKGDILPVCSDYESWDKDYLEERIHEVASELKIAYEKGIDNNEMSSKIIHFIKLCKDVKEMCLQRRSCKDDGFNSLVLKKGTIIGNIYFTTDYQDFSVKVGGLEYASWKNSLEIENNCFNESGIDRELNLILQYINESGDLKPKKRSVNFMELMEKKE
jgi:hypothetical protein